MEVITMSLAGCAAYTADLWNWFDWINFLVYYLYWVHMQMFINARDYGGDRCAESIVCSSLGYFDDW
jgi:hypothetical protein